MGEGGGPARLPPEQCRHRERVPSQLPPLQQAAISPPQILSSYLLLWNEYIHWFWGWNSVLRVFYVVVMTVSSENSKNIQHVGALWASLAVNSHIQHTHRLLINMLYALPRKQISQKSMKVVAWECEKCVIWEWSEIVGAPCPPPGSNFRILSLQPLILDKNAHIPKFSSNMV